MLEPFAKFGSGAFAGDGHKRHKKHKSCFFVPFVPFVVRQLFDQIAPEIETGRPFGLPAR